MRRRARQLAEARVSLGGLGIGHSGQLLLHRSDARQRRLAVGALLAQLPGKLAELALELLPPRVRVLDVLLADLVGDVLDALGNSFRRLACGAALGDHVVLRVRPRDEKQGHRQPDADDRERPPGQSRPKRSTQIDRVQAGASVVELTDLERIIGLVAGQLEGRSEPLAKGKLLVRPSGGLDERWARANDHDRPCQRPDPDDTELDIWGELEWKRAGQQLDERDAEHGRGEHQDPGADGATPPQPPAEAAQPADGIGAETTLDRLADGSVAHRSTSPTSSTVACPGSSSTPTAIGPAMTAGRRRRNAQRMPAGTTSRVERKVSSAARATNVIAMRGHQ